MELNLSAGSPEPDRSKAMGQTKNDPPLSVLVFLSILQVPALSVHFFLASFVLPRVSFDTQPLWLLSMDIKTQTDKYFPHW